MTPNELLLWMSARNEGSWVQFRSAVETLDLAEFAEKGEEDVSLPLHQRVRYNLERLGHVEFDVAGCEDGWRVVPPVLALCDHGSKVTGVLCGARTRKLMERFARAGSGLTLEQSSQTECPDVIRVHASNTDILMELAKSEGILCQADMPTALLSHLPPIGSLRGLRREPLPSGGKDWDVKQFTIKRKAMKWRTITLQEANAPGARGLFRCTLYQTPQYFLREEDETVRLPGSVGKYYVLSRRQRRVLRYSLAERRLTLLAIFRPPLLTERALILCSGFPPLSSVVHRRPRLTYCDVPEEVAGLAAEVLGQDLL
ncbi:MAG: hypothetical protein JWO19_3625 [Bryobacterales bacterium]|nr:hypothetical protein [Bryobacterales bacterium]